MLHAIKRHRPKHAARSKSAKSAKSAATKRPKKWLKGAIRHPGALRTAVKRRYGHHGFDHEGRIRCEVLRTLAHEHGKTAARARLAMRLRGMAGVPCAVPHKRK